MRLRIGDETFDVLDSMKGAALGDLVELKRQTRRPDFEGITVRTIQRSFAKLATAAVPGADPVELLTDDDYLENLIALVWLAKRKAGEEITLADAAAISFDDVSFDFSDEDDEDDAPKGSAAESSDLSE